MPLVSVDERAFFIVTDAKNVFGNGFESISEVRWMNYLACLCSCCADLTCPVSVAAAHVHKKYVVVGDYTPLCA